MIPLGNLRGYTASDPLDGVRSRTRLLLCVGVTFAVCVVFLHLIIHVLGVARLKWPALFWLECAGVALVYAPVVMYLRKSSSLLLVALLPALFIPLDIALEARVRMQGREAWWMYANWFLPGVSPLVRFSVVWFGDALVMGPGALWLSRVIAKYALRARPEPVPSKSQTAALFSEEWSSEPQARPQRDFCFWVLRIVGLLYLAYTALLVIGLFGVSPWPARVRELLEMSYANPALTINTFIKTSFVISLAFIGAYNPKLRFHVGGTLFVAHAVSTAASLMFYFTPGASHRDFLLASAAADAAMAGFLLWAVWHHRAMAGRFRREKDFPEFFSVPQRLTRVFWRIFAVVCAGVPIGVLLIRFFADASHGWGAVYGYPDPLVCNTLTKYATMSVIGFVIATREELRENLLLVIVNGFLISVITSVAWLLFGDLISDVGVQTRGGSFANVDWYFAFNVACDAPVAALILALRKSYYNVDHGITALSATSARNVVALQDTLFPELPADGRLAQSIDRHVAGIRGRKRGLLNFPFGLLEGVWGIVYGLRPPFSTMSQPERSYWLREYVLRPPRERARALLPALAELSYRLGSAAHAFVTLAHYSSTRGGAEVGFIPSGARARLQGRYPSAPPPSGAARLPTQPDDPMNFVPAEPAPRAALPLIAPRVVTPVCERALPLEVDYLIVGSGAGGAVMAYRLARQVEDPTRVLVVERGPRFSPITDFDDDEMDSLRKLYKEGGLQQTRRFRLSILQGECVGGSTVINNAACAKMPDPVRKRWRDDFGIALAGLDDEYTRIQKELGISALDQNAVNQPVLRSFLGSVKRHNELYQEEPLSLIQLESNHRAPLGTGLDNIGDRHLRKRSMLETYLPWAEGCGVRVIAETTAVRFVSHERGSQQHATEVILRSNLGQLERVTVKKAVIVAGGVIASSHFLLRSGVRGAVGHNVSCNFALPAALELEQQVDAYDGLQITAGAIDSKSRAIFETYFNPPGAFAISLPFYFDRQRELMRRYSHLVNFGALVGSAPGGRIELKADVLDGRAISWRLEPSDVENLKFAYGTLVRLAHAAGAQRVVLRTEPGLDICPTADKVESFVTALRDYPLRMADLGLATAHPQGGNRMAGELKGSSRVVGPDFRVDGWDNVYVADASVFPTGITVNPQWTIMSLASLAAEHVLHEPNRLKASGVVRSDSTGSPPQASHAAG
jgi:choline dehydrogenase-like flavoprotein